jgi:hypothetical protein
LHRGDAVAISSRCAAGRTNLGGHAGCDLSFVSAATVFDKYVVDYYAGPFRR